MTEREKVIKGLEIARKLAWNGEHCNIMDADDALTVSYAITDAIALLKAQEPVTPDIEGNTEYDGHGSWWHVCGACRQPIDKDDAFCRWCGKPVNWND